MRVYSPCQLFEFLAAKPHLDRTIHQGNGGWCSTLGAHSGLHILRQPQVYRLR